MQKGDIASVSKAGLQTAHHSDDIIRKYMSDIRRFFMRRVPPSDVDDMVQNVALRMEMRRSDERIENVGGYAYKVAQSVMLDQLRRDQSRHLSLQQELEERHHPVEDLSPHRILSGKEELSQVITALEHLPERTRQAFILHRFESMSYSMIADHMGISVSAVEKHIMRAMRQLNSIIQK